MISFTCCKFPLSQNKLNSIQLEANSQKGAPKHGRCTTMQMEDNAEDLTYMLK